MSRLKAAMAAAPERAELAEPNHLQARLLVLLLAILPASPCAAQPDTADAIATQILAIARGQDTGIPQPLAPAESTDRSLTREARIGAVIRRMSAEIQQVAAAFRAAPEALASAQVRRAVTAFSADTARDGAARAFEGTGPSLSVMRQLLLIPNASRDAGLPERVMRVISSFERSPKPEDTYYEYSDAQHLKTSAILALEGSDTSWTTRARQPMEPGRTYALKKCRSVFILGWYCSTALYQVRAVPGQDDTRLLVTFLLPLPAGADNPTFDDDRGRNTVTGYTGAYAIVGKPDLILVYQIGIQSTAEEPSFQSMLAEEHLEEHRELIERLRTELKLDRLR